MFPNPFCKDTLHTTADILLARANPRGAYLKPRIPQLDNSFCKTDHMRRNTCTMKKFLNSPPQAHDFPSFHSYSDIRKSIQAGLMQTKRIRLLPHIVAPVARFSWSFLRNWCDRVFYFAPFCIHVYAINIVDI